jgi:hypothetical protein
VVDLGETAEALSPSRERLEAAVDAPALSDADLVGAVAPDDSTPAAESVDGCVCAASPMPKTTAAAVEPRATVPVTVEARRRPFARARILWATPRISCLRPGSRAASPCLRPFCKSAPCPAKDLFSKAVCRLRASFGVLEGRALPRPRPIPVVNRSSAISTVREWD